MPDATSTGSIAEHRTQGAPGELADRHGDVGAEHVVGVGTAEQVLVDVLLHREVPAHAEDLDARAAHEGGHDQGHEHRVEAEHQHRQRHRRAREHAPAAAVARGVPAAGPRSSRAGPLPPRRGRSPSPAGRSVSSATTGPSVKSAPLWIMLSAPKPSTTTHSHVVRRKKVHPSRSSATVLSGARALERRDPHRGEQQGRDGPGQRVDGERPAGADGDHEQRAERGAEHGEAVAGQRQQRVGGLQLVARDQLRHHARPSRGTRSPRPRRGRRSAR